ncbi:MAG: SUMF1/EgtB/PvdO family nonheme iron enzyme [Sandaracinus sp.]|nr:SUMF1/EgtB/PvdO family nonheme iron enzyme [Sandaracinus sp.]
MSVDRWLVYEEEQKPEALRPRLVWLPGGTFTMGSPDDQSVADERPQHEVTLTRFAMCETEVTVKQYGRAAERLRLRLRRQPPRAERELGGRGALSQRAHASGEPHTRGQ